MQKIRVRQHRRNGRPVTSHDRQLTRQPYRQETRGYDWLPAEIEADKIERHREAARIVGRLGKLRLWLRSWRRGYGEWE